MAKEKQEDGFDFSNIKDLNNFEDYPQVKKYRDLLSKKAPFTMAFMDAFPIEYRERSYPYNSIFIFKGCGEIDDVTPDIALKIEETQKLENGNNAFIEAIANGIFIVGIDDVHDVKKYQTLYRERLLARQEEILKKNQDALSSGIKVSPYQPE